MTAYDDDSSGAAGAGGALSATVEEVAQYFSAWTESHQHGYYLVRLEDLCVVWASGAGQALASARRQFTLTGGRVTLVDRGRQAEFDAFVRSIGAGRPAAWSISGDDDGPTLIFRAERVDAPGLPPVAVMAVYSSETPYVWPDLKAKYGLTAGELRVLERMLDGLAAEDVAREAGIAVDTARSHIRSIYGKLNVNGREQLFAEILRHRVR